MGGVRFIILSKKIPSFFAGIFSSIWHKDKFLGKKTRIFQFFSTQEKQVFTSPALPMISPILNG